MEQFRKMVSKLNTKEDTVPLIGPECKHRRKQHLGDGFITCISCFERLGPYISMPPYRKSRKSKTKVTNKVNRQ